MYFSIIDLLYALGFAVVGALVCSPLLYLNIKYAATFGLVDWPKARGMSDEQVPIIGHTLVGLSLLVIMVLAYRQELSGWFVITSILVAVMGYCDDHRPLAPDWKLIIQAISVGVMVFLEPNIVENFTRHGIWGGFLATFFIIGLMNAVNFIDGIDGLAGIVLMVGGAGIILFTQGFTGQYAYLIYASIVVGMLVPFFYLNVFKKKAFLGNIGSYFFGFTFAVSFLSIPMNHEQPLARVSIMGLCFLIPIADSCVVIMSRLLTVRSPFQGDRGHLHHRLVQTSVKLRFVLVNFTLIGLAGLVVAILLNEVPSFPSGLVPFVICFSHVGIIAVLILMIEKASKRRVQSYLQRMDSGEPLHYVKYHLKRDDGKTISIPTLYRLEAKIATEIRVTDVCFIERPDTFFVAFKAGSEEAVNYVLARITPIFEAEKLSNSVIVDQGEYVKVSGFAKAALKTA